MAQGPRAVDFPIAVGARASNVITLQTDEQIRLSPATDDDDNDGPDAAVVAVADDGAKPLNVQRSAFVSTVASQQQQTYDGVCNA